LRGGKRPNSGRKAGVKTSLRTVRFQKMVTVIENEKLEMYLQGLRMKGGKMNYLVKFCDGTESGLYGDKIFDSLKSAIEYVIAESPNFYDITEGNYSICNDDGQVFIEGSGKTIYTNAPEYTDKSYMSYFNSCLGQTKEISELPNLLKSL